MPHVHNVHTASLAGRHIREKTMAERLGLGVIPGVGWSAREVQTIARQAEEAGFDTVCGRGEQRRDGHGATDGDCYDPDRCGHVDCQHLPAAPLECLCAGGCIHWRRYWWALHPRPGCQPSASQPGPGHRYVRAAGRVAALCHRRAALAQGGRASHPYPAAASALSRAGLCGGAGLARGRAWGRVG